MRDATRTSRHGRHDADGSTRSHYDADAVRLVGREAPVKYHVEGAGTLRVEAAGPGERVLEPHVAVLATITEPRDDDAGAWSVGVSFSSDAARAFADDLATIASDEQWRDAPYTTTPTLAITVRGETPDGSVDVTRAAQTQIAANWHHDDGREVCLFPDAEPAAGGKITVDRDDLTELSDRLLTVAGEVEP